MKLTPRYNFGNFPNRADYDPSIPIGYWHWDDEPDEEPEEPDEDIALEEED